MRENKKIIAKVDPSDSSMKKISTVCPSCGVAMRVSDKNYAYFCPVCHSTFALKKHRVLSETKSEIVQEACIAEEKMPIEEIAVAQPPVYAAATAPTMVAAPAAKNATARVTRRKKSRTHEKFTPLTATMLVVLSIYVFILFFLLLWAVMQVFKHPMDFNKNPIWFPKKDRVQQGFTLVNFRALLAFSETTWMGSDASSANVGFMAIITNSLVYALGGSFVNAAVTCLVAYLTARYHYFYSKIIYSIVIVVMVVPIVGAQASEIEVLKRIGLYNTRFGFIALKAGFVGMYFLVFYETFKAIPMTYSEAAMMDGASDWCIMTRICLPLTVNVFMTVMLITFISYWNDYQIALLYMPDYPTLAFFLFKVQNSSTKISVPGVAYKIGMDRAPIKMTATVVLMTPILILFIALNEKLMGNLSIGGIKG